VALDAQAPDAAKGGADGGVERPAMIREFSINVRLASVARPEAPGTVGIVTWSLPGIQERNGR